ncbi:MAG: hypothetical protein ABI321_22980 [Polyangia bacterium]
MTRTSSHLSDDLLQRYHDGELSAVDRVDVESRLDGESRLRLEALDELRGLLRTHSAAECSGVDFASIIDAIEKSPPAVAKAPPRKRRGLVSLSAFSAFAAGAFALFFFLRSGPPSNEAAVESLEVSGGSATVLRMPDDRNPNQTTTIIWASLEEEPGQGTGGTL